MIPRIRSVRPMPDYLLSVSFDDGKRVVYDVKEDMNLPGYGLLREVYGLFEQVQLDTSRTCVFWNDEIDIPSDAIYAHGLPLEERASWDPDFTKLTPAEAAALREVEAEIARGETVPDSAIDWDAP